MRWCSEAISVSGAHALAPASLLCNTSSVFQFQKSFLKLKFNNTFSSSSLTHRKPLAAQAQASIPRDDFDFVVVNFYHFVFIKDPQEEVAKHLSFLELEVRFHFILFLPFYTHNSECI